MAFTISSPVVQIPQSSRGLQDANYVSTVALVAGATVNCSSFDLLNVPPNVALEKVVPSVVTAASVISSTGTVAGQWQDSADNSSFANISGMGSVTLSVANGTNYNWAFPWTVTRRYVRLTLTASSANASGNVTAALNF